MTELLLPLGKGFVTAGSLIIAIGAQNAFVLSQGLRKKFNFWIALVCGSLDTLLIFIGIAGMGVLISRMPTLMMFVAIIGGIFLFSYGVFALRSALNPGSLETKGYELSSRKSAILTTLAISLLNPHVYLDTVVLIGNIGGQHPEPQRWWFAAGAALSSFCWFFSLSFAANKLAPIFQRARTWQILDTIIFVIMWVLSYSLFSMAYTLFQQTGGVESI